MWLSSLKLAYSLAAIAVLCLAMGTACGGGATQPTPMPTGSPAATPTAAPAAALEIAYASPQDASARDIWVTAVDGSAKRNVTQGRCPGPQGLEWSPTGDLLACIGTGSAARPQTLVTVFDLEGRLLLRLQHSGAFRSYLAWAAKFASMWSPDGRNLAYAVDEEFRPVLEEDPPGEAPVLVITDAIRGIITSIVGGQQPRWSADGRLAYFKPPGDTLALYELASGREKTLGEGLRPLAWVLGDRRLLVAANYREQELGGTVVTYEANLLDPASGQMTRVPELDNYAEFWLSPDRATAIVSSPTGPAIGVLDLASLQFTPIAGSVIGYPSEFIPQWQLAFSPDGSQVYWVDQSGWTPHAIYRANMDGTGLTKLGEVPGWFGAFSPDLTRVLYRGPDTGRDLWIADIDGSDARLLAENASDPIWLPPAPLAPSVTAPQLAYIDEAGDMWLTDAADSDRRNLTEGNPLRCPRPMGLYWSPNGEWIACVGTGSPPDEQTTLFIVDTEGRPHLGMEPKARLESFAWWPTGLDYTYVLVLPDGTRQTNAGSIGVCSQPGPPLEDGREVFWSPDGSQAAYAKGPGDTLAMYDVASQQEEVVMDGLRPLAWVLDGKSLLVASNYKEGQGIYATYTANLLDLATGELPRMPQLDNVAQFWPSPDGRTVAFFTHQEGAEISLLDLSTGAVTPIPGAVPYEREWIPPNHVAFSPDGSQLFWADLLPAPAEGPRSVAIYRANADGSAKAKLGEIETVELRFSPDVTKVLYRATAPGTDNALWVANVDGSEARLLAESAWPVAWRPLPSLRPTPPAAAEQAALSAEQAIRHVLDVLALDSENQPDTSTATAQRMTEAEAQAFMRREAGQPGPPLSSDRPVWLVEVRGRFHGFKSGPPGAGRLLTIVCLDGRGGGASAFIPDQ